MVKVWFRPLSQLPCKVMAVLLHFFFLSAFAWMLVEGLHLYSMVVKVFGSEGSKHFYYYGIGWGRSLTTTTTRRWLQYHKDIIVLTLTSPSVPVLKYCWYFWLHTWPYWSDFVHKFDPVKRICFELHSSITIGSPDLSEPEFDGQIKRIRDIHILSLAAEECTVSPSHAEPISGKTIPFLLLPFFWPE